MLKRKKFRNLLQSLTNSSSVLKWCLNRSEQAKNSKALVSIAGLGMANDSYKPLRPSQILKSESLVNQVQEVLRNEYIDPFDHTLDKTKLYNLSSGIPLDVETTKDILDIPNTGVRLAEEFWEKRLMAKTLDFHAPITQNKYQSFSKALKTVTIKKR